MRRRSKRSNTALGSFTGPRLVEEEVLIESPIIHATKRRRGRMKSTRGLRRPKRKKVRDVRKDSRLGSLEVLPPPLQENPTFIQWAHATGRFQDMWDVRDYYEFMKELIPECFR